MTPSCQAWIEIEGWRFTCHRDDDHTGDHETDAEIGRRSMWITWRQN